MLAGGVIYVLGMFVVTAVFNVPLNDALAAVDPSGAEGLSLAQEGRGEGGAMAKLPLRLLDERIFAFHRRREIVDMRGSSIDDGTSGDPLARDRTCRAGRDGSEGRVQSQGVTLDPIDLGVIGFAESSRILGDRVQHGLKLCRRAGDDP